MSMIRERDPYSRAHAVIEPDAERATTPSPGSRISGFFRSCAVVLTRCCRSRPDDLEFEMEERSITRIRKINEELKSKNDRLEWKLNEIIAFVQDDPHLIKLYETGLETFSEKIIPPPCGIQEPTMLKDPVLKANCFERKRSAYLMQLTKHIQTYLNVDLEFRNAVYARMGEKDVLISIDTRDENHI